MWIFRSGPDRALGAGLLVLRFATGVVFVAHGAQKAFTIGIPGVIGGFTEMGVPMPSVTAPLVVGLELLGGLALIVGLLTRLTALGLAIDMAGAVLLVHLPAGFFLPTGYEFALLLGLSMVALVLTGPGRYSIDQWFARRGEAVPPVPFDPPVSQPASAPAPQDPPAAARTPWPDKPTRPQRRREPTSPRGEG